MPGLTSITTSSACFSFQITRSLQMPTSLEIGSSLEALHTHIPSAGEYVVTLTLAGSEKLDVRALTIRLGDKEIPAFGTPVTLDATNRTAQFELIMPEPDLEKPLVMWIDCDGDKPNSGTISIAPACLLPPNRKPRDAMVRSC